MQYVNFGFNYDIPINAGFEGNWRNLIMAQVLDNTKVIVVILLVW